MFNYNEVKSLSELKEMCFYIKATNECGADVNAIEGVHKLKNYLKKQYNLEISVSKLYLFVEKIKNMFQKQDKFPTDSDVKNILYKYIEHINKTVNDAELELAKLELALNEPKHKVKKNQYKSTSELSEDISVKKTMYTKKNNSLLIWAGVIGLFIVSSIYCIIGVVYPNILALYITKPQEIAVVILSLLIITLFSYLILYLINKQSLTSWKFAVVNFYKHEPSIKQDINNYNLAKQNLFKLKNAYSINGIELTNETMFNFMYNSDELDVKHFANNLQKKSINKKVETPSVWSSNVISRYEQNLKWRESQSSKIEKDNMNKEIVARISSLLDYLTLKNLSDIDLAQKLSEMYCTEFSVEVRKAEIDDVPTKLELSNNYLRLINKIIEYENLDFLIIENKFRNLF